MVTYTATWEGEIIAESDKTVEVEGNQYFPLDSVNSKYLQPSDHTSRCPWKGGKRSSLILVASYRHVDVNGKVNQNAVWIYEDPKPAAKNIQNYFAFWKGVEVAKKA
ncbi:hypothetical protein BC833DRAFT_624946 [Globomyces pollinis-pini]|nr:hypothetical protein BC833DRAFT_624946 [Globomyces pollinis-pini]